MRVVAIIQARMTSTRFPGKILKPLAGKPVLQHVITRLRSAAKIDGIAVATTINKEDDLLEPLCREWGVECFRGSESDVLDRFYQAAKVISPEYMIRITSDCPCVDPAIIDALVELHISSKADYTSNVLRRTFPHGLDAEIFNFSSFEKVCAQAKSKYDHEHVTPYFYTNPDKFTLSCLEASADCFGPDIRITLDTQEDYALLNCVYDYLYKSNVLFSAKDIVSLFAQKPWLKIINKKIIQKRKFDDLKDELQEAVRLLKMQELDGAAGILEKQLHEYGEER